MTTPERTKIMQETMYLASDVALEEGGSCWENTEMDDFTAKGPTFQTSGCSIPTVEGCRQILLDEASSFSTSMEVSEEDDCCQVSTRSGATYTESIHMAPAAEDVREWFLGGVSSASASAAASGEDGCYTLEQGGMSYTERVQVISPAGDCGDLFRGEASGASLSLTTSEDHCLISERCLPLDATSGISTNSGTSKKEDYRVSAHTSYNETVCMVSGAEGSRELFHGEASGASASLATLEDHCLISERCLLLDAALCISTNLGTSEKGDCWASARSGTSYNERVCVVSGAEGARELFHGEASGASASLATSEDHCLISESCLLLDAAYGISKNLGTLEKEDYWASAHSGTSYNERVCTVSAAEDVGELAPNQVLSTSASSADFADLEVSVPSFHSGKSRMGMSDESDSNLNR